VEVLFRNEQWAVIREGDTVFLTVSDLDSDACWMCAADLVADFGGYTQIEHILQKRWVDRAAFESASRVAIAEGGMPPRVDINAVFQRGAV
jgi:hypothetical protein